MVYVIEVFGVIFALFSTQWQNKTQLLGPVQPSKCSFFWLLLFRVPKLQITGVAGSLRGGSLSSQFSIGTIARWLPTHFPTVPLFKPDIAAILQRFSAQLTWAIRGWRGRGRFNLSPAQGVALRVELERKRANKINGKGGGGCRSLLCTSCCCYLEIDIDM